ncbi:MAG TPA: ATP-binding protein, partial [Devosia sp.]|nr:ATP-binding protein [Devosia sp.]
MALFGANASGKSTVLRALSFLAWFARDSVTLNPDIPLPYEPFKDAASWQQPTRLCVHFTGPTDPSLEAADQQYSVYEYELMLSNDPNSPHQVLRETLRRQPEGRGRFHRVFERQGSTIQSSDSWFRIGAFESVTLRKTASAISTLAQLGHQPSLKLREVSQRVLTNILSERFEPRDEDASRYYLSNPQLLERVNREIERIDLGIRSVKPNSDNAKDEVVFMHQGLGMPMRWSGESHGTRALLRYFPLIDYALENGGVAVIDELDASIHPMVVEEVFRWFIDPERNRYDAQLWLTCHNASLLHELQKEEILLCEKSMDGQALVYSLTAIASVRRDDNFYKKYV